MIKVSPSLISCKLEILGKEIAACDEAGVFSYHIDIMDGHFVPNLTSGPDFVKAINRSTDKPLESHLMIERPDRYYKNFIEAGSDILLVHQECLVDFRKLIADIKAEGAGFGIVINPETPFSKAEKFLEESDILLVMSVHPGFSGQKFIDYAVPKIAEARKFIDEQGLKTKIEVDGGVTDVTGRKALEAGADILVSASYIFSGNIGERIRTLQFL
ncbi:MAG: ribulose-phosphate 3-epimerase [Candidatus Thermoplasmatota archaeon]|nr:ribulose-phosphate 3-epimerase [Candidatus Thermoplasmatota archaeon]